MQRHPATSEWARFVGSLGTALLVAFPVWAWTRNGPLAGLLGAIGASGLFLALIWIRIGRRAPDETAAMAVSEDDNRLVADLLLLVACTVSLVAIGFGLHHAHISHGSAKAGWTCVSAVAIVLSWAVVHTVFTLRYADLYYRDEPGGIDFGDDQPDYLDFAYFAFGVGMAFQVSDTAITSRRIRRTVLAHTLVAYLYGTAIIAASINVVASFV